MPPTDDPLLRAVREALAPSGIGLAAAFDAARWDAEGPPRELRAAQLLDGGRSFVVVGSAGGGLWQAFVRWAAESPRERVLEEPHPLDRFVRLALDRADEALAREGVRARRFEPTFQFDPRLDFQRLGALAGLGTRAPIGVLAHPEHGPWWATRGAWLIDRAVERLGGAAGGAPCRGCPAPCRQAIPPGAEGTIGAATIASRDACLLTASRYPAEQVDYHYGGSEARERLCARLAG